MTRSGFEFGLGVQAFSVAFMALSLGACSFLPSAGPMAGTITDQSDAPAQADDTGQWYQLIQVDDQVVRVMRGKPSQSLARLADGQGPIEPRIGVGDVLRVTIWETAGAGALFTTSVPLGIGAGSQAATIPDQIVTQNGTLTVPFAGRLDVVGLTAQEVETAIRRRLLGKASDPQVLVSIVRSNSTAVTVSGDAVTGAQVPLTSNGVRILDAIATVGGIKSPVNETMVVLTRSGQTQELAYQALVQSPSENVFLRPGDMLTVEKRPVTFTVLGAAGANSEVNFDRPNLTLVQALGRSGGLSDQRADAAGVFLFRREAARDVLAIRPDSKLAAIGGPVPVIYQFDLSDARGLLYAQTFQMQPGDLIYIANAPAAEFQKFLQLVLGVAAVPRNFQ